MIMTGRSLLESLAVPRPVGSENNRRLAKRLAVLGKELGYEVEELPFDCFSWRSGASWIGGGAPRMEVFPSPFSPPAAGQGELLFLDRIERLRDEDLAGRIVVLHGAIAAEPLMPRGFPFCQVQSHKEIADLLELGRPLAVLSAMGGHPMCGLDPCPMFEDCHFQVPSGYFPASQLEFLRAHFGGERAAIFIDSEAVSAAGQQIVIHKRGMGGRRGSAPDQKIDTVLISAHMDTAYNTPGALDNAAGLYALLRLMERLADRAGSCHIQFVPFNGEDYADVSGQRAYLAKYREPDRLKLVINMDGIGYSGSANSLSFYNLPGTWEESITRLLEQYPSTRTGAPWYEGDHSMFAMQGVPALAFVSSGLEALTAVSHTERDTADNVDISLAEELAEVVEKILEESGVISGQDKRML